MPIIDIYSLITQIIDDKNSQRFTTPRSMIKYLVPITFLIKGGQRRWDCRMKNFQKVIFSNSSFHFVEILNHLNRLTQAQDNPNLTCVFNKIYISIYIQ